MTGPLIVNLINVILIESHAEWLVIVIMIMIMIMIMIIIINDWKHFALTNVDS